MYWSHSRELLGEARSRRSKAAASLGCRLGSISSASRCSSAFSAAFFSRSSSCRDFFWDWQMIAAENVQVTDESENARIRKRWSVLSSASPCCFCLVPLRRWIGSPALQQQASGSSVPHPRRSLKPPAAWMAPQGCSPPAETNEFYFPDSGQGNEFTD